MSNNGTEGEQSIKTNSQGPPRTRSIIKKEQDNLQIVVSKIKSENRIVKKKMKRKRLYTKAKRVGLRKRTEIPAFESFTPTEDKLILSSVLKLGPKFKVISTFFPQKSLSTVKNRYYKFLRYRWIQIMGKDYDTMYKESQTTVPQNEEIIETVELFPDVKDILMNMISKIKSLILQ
ncbi:unnamed protein product [Paramecium sonneborni]|uniref:Myb-like domain-containing protein n=1 Tax=Paramecium sonneborni TaxID=65129 RepID=A0A8S1NVZ8_9CILI|nr:unnamed protein product [Paramecium sonneborni]CAD8093654.1 unnamed protein product [Paramecium sonneborni]